MCRPYTVVENIGGTSTAWCHVDWRHSAAHELRQLLLVSQPCLRARLVTLGHHQGVVLHRHYQSGVHTITSLC